LGLFLTHINYVFSTGSHSQAGLQTTTTIKPEAAAAVGSTDKKAEEAGAETTTRAKAEAENNTQAIDFVKVEEAELKRR
jgi:hypothetical protein